MCLLIASFSKVKNENWLYNGFRHNDDGAGFAYAHEGKLTMSKGFFDFEEFLAAYNATPDCPNLVHFRLSTGGKMDRTNCHPFLVTKNVAFGHNGIFHGINPCDNFSDTYHFNEDYLKPLFAKNTNALFTDAAREVLSDFIGMGNKLAFLNSKGQISVVNARAGQAIKDTWFSNSSFLYGGFAGRSFFAGRGLDDFFQGDDTEEIPVEGTVVDDDEETAEEELDRQQADDFIEIGPVLALPAPPKVHIVKHEGLTYQDWLKVQYDKYHNLQHLRKGKAAVEL